MKGICRRCRKEPMKKRFWPGTLERIRWRDGRGLHGDWLWGTNRASPSSCGRLIRISALRSSRENRRFLNSRTDPCAGLTPCAEPSRQGRAVQSKSDLALMAANLPVRGIPRTGRCSILTKPTAYTTHLETVLLSDLPGREPQSLEKRCSISKGVALVKWESGLRRKG